MNDLKNLVPPILMAQGIVVMIPIGAIPRRISSPQPMEVERNCFVISPPKSDSNGAKSVNKLSWKF
jgi:hypothetical protein